MRILLGIALASVLGIAALLFLDPPKRRAGLHATRKSIEATRPPPVPPPARDIAEIVAARPHAPATQRDLVRFVAGCVKRGREAVPDLLRRLDEGFDVALDERWRFADGRVKGYPTLRAALIDALASIPGEKATAALSAALDRAASTAETLQISLALRERGEQAWTVRALQAATAATTAADLGHQTALVELAAATAPRETAAQVVARAPRGNDATDPQVLARALRVLPLDQAMLASRQVFLDEAVTKRARGRYLRALCNRPEAEVFRHVRDLLGERTWADEMRFQVAYAAAGAESFYADEAAFRAAVSRGDAKRAQEIRMRFSARLREVQALVEASLGAELASAHDPRAASLKRLIDRHRKRLD